MTPPEPPRPALRKSSMGGSVSSKEGWSISFHSSLPAHIDSILYTEADRTFTLACTARAGKLLFSPDALLPAATGSDAHRTLVLNRIHDAATHAGWSVNPRPRKPRRGAKKPGRGPGRPRKEA